jgi:aminoglycoside phosphotransferase (APT) family kinase protein
MNEELAQNLAQVISSRTGEPCSITSLIALSGGANNQTWRFTLGQCAAAGEYILRRSFSEQEDSISKKLEAEIQKTAGTLGIPVAPVNWVLEPTDNMGSGYIMTAVNGETIPQKILRNPKFAPILANMAFHCGELAARIHSMDPSKLKGLEEQDSYYQLNDLRTIYQANEQCLPVMELAFRWLEDNQPPPQPLKVVHGDYRNGNFIVGPDGIRAILDWELAHLGDPMEDLGWICVNSWRFGQRDKPAGGFGSREALYAGYESEQGSPVNPERVHFWEVLGTLKWGITCMYMSQQQDNDTPLLIERAAIGRRVSEAELDLLQLLKGAK